MRVASVLDCTCVLNVGRVSQEAVVPSAPLEAGVATAHAATTALPAHSDSLGRPER